MKAAIAYSLAALAVAGALVVPPVHAADGSLPTLRVCAARNAPPYSTEDGGGFENRIAKVVAGAMGREVETIWLDKPPIYLVRDALDKHACDVVIGMDTGDPRVLTTQPYFRSGYVFITRDDRHLDVTSWSDPRLLKLARFAVSFDSPGEEMLKQIGRYDDNLSYDYSLVGFKSRRNQYVQIDPALLVSEVVSEKADIAIAFAPEVARYVRASAVPLRMTLITDDAVRADGQKVPQRFSQSAGVRKDDPRLLAQLNAALTKARPEIRRILEQEGIPLVPDQTSQGKHDPSE